MKVYSKDHKGELRVFDAITSLMGINMVNDQKGSREGIRREFKILLTRPLLGVVQK